MVIGENPRVDVLDLLPTLLLRSAKRPPIIQTPRRFLQTTEGGAGPQKAAQHEAKTYEQSL